MLRALVEGSDARMTFSSAHERVRMGPVPQACPPQRRTATNALRAALYRDAVAIVRADFGRQLTLTEVSERLAASPRG